MPDESAIALRAGPLFAVATWNQKFLRSSSQALSGRNGLCRIAALGMATMEDEGKSSESGVRALTQGSLKKLTTIAHFVLPFAKADEGAPGACTIDLRFKAVRWQSWTRFGIGSVVYDKRDLSTIYILIVVGMLSDAAR